MNVNEIQAKREELECAILDLCNKFKQETGLAVESVYLQTYPVYRMSERDDICISKVEIEVQRI